MTTLCGLVGRWVYGLALVGVWAGCTPRTDIGVGSDEGGGGEGLSSPQAGSGGSAIDGEGGNEQGGSSGSDAGSSAAAGGDLVGGGSGGSTTGGGASGTSGTSGDSGGAETGGTAGTDTGGTAGTDTGGTSGTAGTDTGGTAGTGTGGGGTGGQAGTGGNTGGKDHCNLDPEVYKDDSASTSSNVPCGRLGDLSAETGFALDVGHPESVESLSKTATRLLSYDWTAAWVLWDLETKTMVKRGRSRPWPTPRCELCIWPLPRAPVLSDTHLAALVSANAKAFDLELRSALDGELVATVATGLEASSQFGFASDGSYLWATTHASIRAWSMGGELLAEASGDYRQAGVSAVPGELRIGSSSSNTIEKISIATGVSTPSAAFQGTFHSWFVDGARFLTTLSTTVRVYSSATLTQEKLFTLPTLDNLTGQGDHVWVAPSTSLDIYALSNPSAPAASYPIAYYSQVFPKGNLIGVVTGSTLSIVQLGQAITQRSIGTLGHSELVFAADAAGNWAFGGDRGEVFEGTDLTRSLSCGDVLSIARADDGTTAVATSDGGILLFKLTADERRYLGSIPIPSSHVELSRDGLVLATSGNLLNPYVELNLSLRVFSLPDQTEIKTWPYDAGDSSLVGFSMSSEGNHFAHVFLGDGLYWQEVRDLDDNVSLSLTDSDTDNLYSRADNPPRLSADGTLVAVPSGNATNLYDNGVLVNALPGRPLAWFDDDRLLVELNGTLRVYDSLGQVQPTANVNAAGDRFDTCILSATEVYTEIGNAIYSLTSGEELWRCDSKAWGLAGAAAASYAVFVGKQAPNKVVFDHY